jgi:hypothetical protein
MRLYPQLAAAVTPLVKSWRWPLVTVKNLPGAGKKESPKPGTLESE